MTGEILEIFANKLFAKGAESVAIRFEFGDGRDRMLESASNILCRSCSAEWNQIATSL